MTSKSCLLAIDAGNSRIKWGLHDGSRFLSGGSQFLTDVQSLAVSWGQIEEISGVVLSNVAGREVGISIAELVAYRNVPLIEIRSESKRCGVRNRYRNVSQLGSDRWAALVAARFFEQNCCLVINCGTATTIDLLTSDGVFWGGTIMPGIGLMYQALEKNTHQLQNKPGNYNSFPRATGDAITTGVIDAICGAVERMRVKAKREKCENPQIIGSGGYFEMIGNHLQGPVEYKKNLVLDGVARIGWSLI